MGIGAQSASNSCFTTTSNLLGSRASCPHLFLSGLKSGQDARAPRMASDNGFACITNRPEVCLEFLGPDDADVADGDDDPPVLEQGLKAVDDRVQGFVAQDCRDHHHAA
jgi:hypothetical protein